jgi:glyoxylase-like metal-dependent hydrolase (beta-lactamase superfamily II)
VKCFGIFVLLFVLQITKAQDSIIEKSLPLQFKELEKYNTPIEYKFDSVTVYAICTGYISTHKKFPEPVFVWLIKTPVGNYLIDAGLAPTITNPDYFKGISKSFFINQFEFYIYRSNNLLIQLKKLHADTNLKSIILTHGHFDHIGYLDKFMRTPVILTETEKNQIEKYGQAAGYEKNTDKAIDFTRTHPLILDKYQITALNRYIQIFRSDTHTKGHLMVLLQSGKNKILFTGDLNLANMNKNSEVYIFTNNICDLQKAVLLFNHSIDLKKE